MWYYSLEIQKEVAKTISHIYPAASPQMTYIHKTNLLFVTPAGPSASGLLEFPALGPDIRLGLGSWDTWSAKVFDSFTVRPRSLEKDSILSQRSAGSQLIKSDNFTSGSQNSLPGRFGNPQSGQFHAFGYLVKPDVVGDGSDDDGGFSFLLFGGQTGEGERLTVASGHEETSEDDLVEFRVGPSGEESVEFDQHVEVEVVGFGGFSDGLAVFFMADVDGHFWVFLGKLFSLFYL